MIVEPPGEPERLEEAGECYRKNKANSVLYLGVIDGIEPRGNGGRS